MNKLFIASPLVELTSLHRSCRVSLQRVAESSGAANGGWGGKQRGAASTASGSSAVNSALLATLKLPAYVATPLPYIHTALLY